MGYRWDMFKMRIRNGARRIFVRACYRQVVTKPRPTSTQFNLVPRVGTAMILGWMGRK